MDAGEGTDGLETNDDFETALDGEESEGLDVEFGVELFMRALADESAEETSWVTEGAGRRSPVVGPAEAV